METAQLNGKAKTSRKKKAGEEGLMATNGIANTAELGKPFSVEVEITGTSPLLFHRWDDGKAVKPPKDKGTIIHDNLEAYLWRNDKGEICMPGEYLRMSMAYAAKFKQDPRSPRKSAFDLFKAGIISLTDLAPINDGVQDYEFQDRRRALIQRQGITRVRPGFHSGWRATIILSVIIPEYVDFAMFSDVLNMAGRLVGVGDFRPTYGRFTVTKSKVL